MSDASLSEPLAKLDWANYHLETLEAEIQRFKDTNPIPVSSKFDKDSGEKYWYVDGKPIEPPDRLSFIAGDFLSALRSSLDYLVWQLVLANGGTPGRWNGFPICEKASHWKTAVSRDRLQGVSDEAFTRVEFFQPCQGHNSYRDRWLLWLESLASIDKHRYLHLFDAGLEGGFFAGLDSPVGTFIHSGRVEDGTEIARIPRKDADVNFLPAIGVAFGPDGPAGNESVRNAFYSIREMVKIILEDFSPFFGPSVSL